MGISTSAAAGALFSPPRKYHFEVYLLGLSYPAVLEVAKLPCFLHCFISHSFAILPRYRSSSRELSFFSRGFSFVPLLSFSLSFFPSLYRAYTFLRGEGARPGAAVNKYDTGIGYKETINQSSGANGTRAPRKPLSGRFLQGYLWLDEKKKRSRNLPKVVQVPRKT